MDLGINISFGGIQFNTALKRDYSVEPALRTIKEVDLYEISVVSIPAYDDTEASLVRSKELAQKVEVRKTLLKKIGNLLEEK